MKICIVSGSRAEFGLLVPIIDALNAEHELCLAITGGLEADQLCSIAGRSFSDIQDIDQINLLGLGGNKQDIANAMGEAIPQFTVSFIKQKPDLIFLAGDRFEIFAAAQAAMICQIPIAHLFGGDVSEGAMDESIRHAITKMAHVHFTTNDTSAKRIAQLGENPQMIFNVGSPAVEIIHTLEQVNKDELFTELGLDQSKTTACMTFHPETLIAETHASLETVLAALDKFPHLQLAISGANADMQGNRFNETLQTYADARPNAIFKSNYGQKNYINLLRQSAFAIGNSSSGLYEAPVVGIRSINIGDRQKSRTRPDSVINVPVDEAQICNAINSILDQPSDTPTPTTIFGKGDTSKQITSILNEVSLENMLIKKFHSLK